MKLHNANKESIVAAMKEKENCVRVSMETIHSIDRKIRLNLSLLLGYERTRERQGKEMRTTKS